MTFAFRISLGLCLAFGFVLPRTALAACGDGAIDGADVCDDGNVTAGDGCSATCTVETGFSCRMQPSIPIANPSFETDPRLAGGGWTVLPTPVNLAIDWVDGTQNGGCLMAGDQTFTIDLNGSNTRGQVSQVIATTAGQRVVVTLLGNANCVETSGTPCTATCRKRLTASVSDGADATGTAYATSAYDLNGGPRSVAWQPVRFEFVARTAMTRLTFTGSDPSFAGPMIDRIAISASVCDRAACGDGAIAGAEQCDDGNTSSGDGCGSDCRLEAGWMCPTAGMRCTSQCGDSVKVQNEECDDGNMMAGDGCSATCTVESRFTCVTNPFTNTSACMMTCGNGTLNPGEACDDGNMVDRDACSNTCLRGPGESWVVSGQCALAVCTTSVCAGCYDTAAPGAMDFACTTALPACDTSAAPTCVRCLVQADCPAGQVCSNRMCSLPDAGPPDSGTVDSGAGDAGPGDAGPADLGVTPDAGPGDAGPGDAGPGDAGAADAGPSATDGGVRDAGFDAGDSGLRPGASGGACTCGVAGTASPRGWLVALAAIGLFFARRRRTLG